MEESLNDKEFILTLCIGKVFFIYAKNQKDAKEKFFNKCIKNSKTNNEEYQKFWIKLHNLVIDGKCTLVENLDFDGVREVTR